MLQLAEVLFSIFTPLVSALVALLLGRRFDKQAHVDAEQALARILSDSNGAGALIASTEGAAPQAGPPVDRSRARLENDSPQGRARLVETLVDSYHRQALDQARFQFWFSVVAATAGFIWILGTGAMAALEQSLSGFSKIIPGTVIEAVALLFFKQAEQTRQRATALYDRLRTDNLNTQAVEIVSSIEDPTLRSAVRAQLALHMVGMAAGAFDVGRFLLPVTGVRPATGVMAVEAVANLQPVPTSKPKLVEDG
jgi:hypothetical protein